MKGVGRPKPTIKDVADTARVSAIDCSDLW
jgi:hypothetical protein